MQRRSELAGLGTQDETLVRRVQAALEAAGRPADVEQADCLTRLHALAASQRPGVILLDDAILDGTGLKRAVLQLTDSAPVVVLAAADKQPLLARLIALGEVEFVVRDGNYLSMAACLVERRLRWAERAESTLGMPWSDIPADFGTILRHEINNPLTGILGNAELLLAQREKMPANAARRLETVVDLAVRLRETTRRLSAAWESQEVLRSA